MKTEHQLRREVAEVSRLLWERGWVSNHDGNVTGRLGPGRILATPTALSKRVIAADMLILVDDDGALVRGRTRPFSELGLHLSVYRARADVSAVVHSHPPYATARAVQGRSLPCFLPESVVSLGLVVPVVPFANPGREAEAALGPFVHGHDAVILTQHGVVAWGIDPEQAFLRMELVEHLARIANLAGPAEPPSLPQKTLEVLLESRRKAGLSR